MNKQDLRFFLFAGTVLFFGAYAGVISSKKRANCESRAVAALERLAESPQSGLQYEPVSRARLRKIAAVLDEHQRQSNPMIPDGASEDYLLRNEPVEWARRELESILGEENKMNICYEQPRFQQSTLGIINRTNTIIEQYEADGMKLTLRQLYYRFIATDAFPDSWIDEKYNAKNGLQPETKNTVKNYKRLGNIVGRGRLAGLISWVAIEDRTRSLKSLPHWSSPSEIIEACAGQYNIDKWEGQENYVEVWIEKDALAGVFQGPCDELDVSYFSCRGYGSLSEVWAAGRRLRYQYRQGRTPIVLHFGDHDPSGLDMTRDIRDRLSRFAEHEVMVERIALNMDQVQKFNPPPNPAKATDSRFEQYADYYGTDSWELDALEPEILRSLTRTAVSNYLDRDLFDERLAEQDAARKTLARISKNWSEIERRFGSNA